MAKNTKLWSDKKITQDFAPYDRAIAKQMRNEYEAELEKARTENSNLRHQVTELTEVVGQLAEKLTADNDPYIEDPAMY